MRLPRHIPGAMQRLAKPDPFAPVREAAAFSQGMQAIAQTAQGLVGMIEERREEEQIYKANDYLRRQEMNILDWEKNNQGKTEYMLDEIPAEIRQSLGITLETYPDGSVPGHIVKPSLKDHFLRGNLQADSAMIEDPNIRARAMGQAQGEAFRAIRKEYQNSVRDQKLYNRSQTILNATEQEQAGNYDEAIVTWKHSSWDQPTIDRNVRRLTRQGQIKQFNDVLESEDVLRLQEMKQMIAEESELLDGLWALSEKDRYSYVRAMQNRINEIERAEAVKAKEGLQSYKAEARRRITENWHDNVVNPGETQQMAANLRRMGEPELALELEQSLGYADMNAQLVTMPTVMAEEYLANYSARVKSGTEAEVYRKLQQSYDTAVRERLDDPMAWYKKWYGGVGVYDALQPGRNLQARIDAARTMTNLYGSPFQLLDDEEAAELVNTYEGMENSQAKLHVIQNTVRAFGDYVYDLTEQMSHEGIESTFIAAGEALRTKRTGDARLIVQGQELLQPKEGRPAMEMSNTVTNNIQTSIVSQGLGAVYSYNKDKKIAMTDAINFVYAALSAKEGDYALKEVNPTRLNKAIEIATGGIVSLNDTHFEAPAKGVNTAKFRTWLEDLDEMPFQERLPEYLRGGHRPFLGRATGFTKGSFIDQLIDGELLLRPRRRGEWYILDPDSGIVYDQTAAKRTPLILKYDADLPRRSERDMAEKARKLAEGDTFNQQIVNEMNQLIQENVTR